MNSFAKIFILFSISFCLFPPINAQETQKSLAIGDKLPVLEFGKNFNQKNKIFNTAELKDKIAILDFFNYACLACIKSMPKMDSLQKMFKEKIQIVLITNSTKSQIEKLFEKHIKMPDLPIIIEDTMFYNTLFPHEGDPLHVWVDKTGIVSAITNGYNATVSNIEKILKGNQPDFYTRPFKSEVEIEKDLVEQLDKLSPQHVESYSLYFKSLSGLSVFSQLTEYRDSMSNKPYKLKALNIPLTTLYTYAYSDILYPWKMNFRNLVLSNLLKVETNNPLDLHYPVPDSCLDEWNQRNLVSYEMLRSNETSYFKSLRDDLERYTSFSAEVKPVLCKSLVLKHKGDKRMLRDSLENIPSMDYYSNGAYIIKNKRIQESLLPELVIAFQSLPYPIVDESAVDFPVTLKIEGPISNLENIRKSLKSYGFTLEIESRLNNFLVIKDKRSPQRP